MDEKNAHQTIGINKSSFFSIKKKEKAIKRETYTKKNISKDPRYFSRSL